MKGAPEIIFNICKISDVDKGTVDKQLITYQERAMRTFDVSLFVFWERRPDSLYHYANARLNPRFTMDFVKKEIPIHDYKELPRHFLGSMDKNRKIIVFKLDV